MILGGKSMLSKQNIDKLNLDGLYTCKADVKYRGKLHEDNLYHCCNWTFDVIKDYEGNYIMRDTYWSSGDGVHIHLTDENIDEFQLLFEKEKVKQISSKEVNHYDNYYRVGIDSGGWSYPKYFVDNSMMKNKERVIKEIDEEIKNLESSIRVLQFRKENIENGSYDINCL